MTKVTNKRTLTPNKLEKSRLVFDNKIEWIDVAILKKAKRNARTHSKKQINQITKSIETFGFTNPILIDDDNNIVAGHGRYEAGSKLQLSKFPTIRLSHLTKDELRTYALADNKIAEQAGWDSELLSLEFQELAELDFDLEITGFSVAEIDSFLDFNVSDGNELDESDQFEGPSEGLESRCKVGQLWQLGRHRLYIGDALKDISYQRLLSEERVTMIFTDPPYNVNIDGHVMGKGKIKHTEFKMASGEMSIEEFTRFLDTAFERMVHYSRDGSIHFICMDWRHLSELLTAGHQHYTELKNLCVWNKDNGGMGTFYRSKHELIFVFKNGTEPHINNFELGQNGRYRTNVWDYAGINSFKADRMEELTMHPTVKPVKLVSDAILDCSKPGNLILDPFAGSGTTLIAAEKTGRVALCIELDPKYGDVILKRWEDLGQGKAELISEGGDQ